MLPIMFQAAASRIDPNSIVFGQPLSVTVRPDGWTAELRVRNFVADGSLALSGGAVTLNLSGTDSLGNAYTRTAKATISVRQPSPNGGLRVESVVNSVDIILLALDQSVLKEEIITSAVIAAGAVTNNGAGGNSALSLSRTLTGRNCVNNSTWLPAKPGVRWITLPFLRARSNTFSVELIAAHRYAQQGRTVRAVKFDLYDSSNALRGSITTNSMVRSVELPNLPAVPCYRASFDLTGISDGSACRVRATVYPWYGPAWVSDVDGEAWPSPNAGDLPLLVDAGGTWGDLFVAVSTTGSDATGAVGLTEAAARTTPYRTIAAALTGARSYNNANRARNNIDGVELVFESGTYIGLSAFTNISAYSSSNGDPVRAWSVWRAATGVTDVVLDGGTAGTQKNPPALTYVRGSGITVQRSGAVGSNNPSLFVGPDVATTGTPTHAAVLDGVGITGVDLNLHTTPILMGIGFCFYRNLTWTNANAAITEFSVNRQMVVQVAGCTLSACGRVHSYSVIGSKFDNGTILFDPSSHAGTARITARHPGWWSVEAFRQPEACYHLSSSHNGAGFIVLTAIERSGTGAATPLLSQSADGVLIPVPEAISLCTTVIGARTNQLYNDSGTAAVVKDGVNIGCANQYRNNKSDYFVPASANRVGNWRYRFGVDSHSNRTLNGSQNGTTFGFDSWLGELAEPNSLHNVGLTGIFVLDASSNGTDAGGGDYRPGSGSPLLNVLSAAQRPLPFDLRGTTYAGECGAYAA